jgi:5-methylcytosine-specific restriction endonuclease McrA
LKDYPDYAKKYKMEDGLVSYFQIGDNTGDRWQVDHIIPIHNGGAGVGLSNVQVLCVECHKKKTAREAGKEWKTSTTQF